MDDKVSKIILIMFGMVLFALFIGIGFKDLMSTLISAMLTVFTTLLILRYYKGGGP